MNWTDIQFHINLKTHQKAPIFVVAVLKLRWSINLSGLRWYCFDFYYQKNSTYQLASLFIKLKHLDFFQKGYNLLNRHIKFCPFLKNT